MKKRLGIGIAGLVLAVATVFAVAGPGSRGCDGFGGWGMAGEGMSQGGIGHGGMHRGGPGYGPQDAQQMQQRMLQRLEQQLSLTEQQKQQVGPLMAEHWQKMATDRAQMEPFREQMQRLDPAAADYRAQVGVLAEQQSELMAQRMVERAGHHAELFALLTPDQQQALQQMEQQRGHRKGGHHRPW